MKPLEHVRLDRLLPLSRLSQERPLGRGKIRFPRALIGSLIDREQAENPEVQTCQPSLIVGRRLGLFAMRHPRPDYPRRMHASTLVW
jgi:hypothetical protein